MTIFDIYAGQLGEEQFDAIAQNIGATTEQVVQGSSQLVPLMVSAMARITRSEAGAKGVYDLIHAQHDGSVMMQLPRLYANPSQFPGDDAFSRMMGDRRDDAAEFVSDETGMRLASTNKLIAINASTLLGMIGGMMRQQNTTKEVLAQTLNDFAAMHENQESTEAEEAQAPQALASPSGGGGLFGSLLGMASGMGGELGNIGKLGNILGMLKGGNKGIVSSLVTGMLDRNKDGSMVDDLAGMVGGFLAGRK